MRIKAPRVNEAATKDLEGKESRQIPFFAFAGMKLDTRAIIQVGDRLAWQPLSPNMTMRVKWGFELANGGIGRNDVILRGGRTHRGRPRRGSAGRGDGRGLGSSADAVVKC